jgi:hypothetical protein
VGMVCSWNGVGNSGSPKGMSGSLCRATNEMRLIQGVVQIRFYLLTFVESFLPLSYDLK